MDKLFTARRGSLDFPERDRIVFPNPPLLELLLSTFSRRKHVLNLLGVLREREREDGKGN